MATLNKKQLSGLFMVLLQYIYSNGINAFQLKRKGS